MKTYKIDLRVGNYRTEVWTKGRTEEEAINIAVQHIREGFGIKTAYFKMLPTLYLVNTNTCIIFSKKPWQNR